MVSIVAFQAVDPGSIPGHRIKVLSFVVNSFLRTLEDGLLPLIVRVGSMLLRHKRK